MTNDNPSPSYALPFGVIVLLTLGIVLFVYNKPGESIPENWGTGWKLTQSFKIPRRALASVATDDHIYVIGGIDAQGHYVTTVEYARIGARGQLGPWQPTSALNQGRFYLAAVVSGHFIFALGGGSGTVGSDNRPVATVERARINPDGSLGPWQMLPTMRLPRRGLQAAVVNDHIYAIGGYSGVFLKSIEHARVGPNGDLTPWQVDPQQARLDRYIHSATAYRNRLYLLGGHVQRSDKMSYGDVESATVLGDGLLGLWKIEKSRLLTPRFIASAFAVNDYLYILGGHNGGARLKSVELAPIQANGHVGKWRHAPPLNVPRSAAAAATTGDYVYVTGGMGDDRVLNSVEMATVTANGQLGYVRR